MTVTGASNDDLERSFRRTIVPCCTTSAWGNVHQSTSTHAVPNPRSLRFVKVSADAERKDRGIYRQVLGGSSVCGPSFYDDPRNFVKVSTVQNDNIALQGL